MPDGHRACAHPHTQPDLRSHNDCNPIPGALTDPDHHGNRRTQPDAIRDPHPDTDLNSYSYGHPLGSRRDSLHYDPHLCPDPAPTLRPRPAFSCRYRLVRPRAEIVLKPDPILGG